MVKAAIKKDTFGLKIISIKEAYKIISLMAKDLKRLKNYNLRVYIQKERKFVDI